MSEARPTEDVSASYQKSYDILKEANVVNLMTDEHKKMSDLWLEKPCIIYVVRRPGCTMCREQGLLLQEKIAEKCKSLGINLVATCKERVGGEEFVKDYWKDGQLYLDADWASFKALGEGTCLEAKWYEIFTPTFISRVFESKKKAKNVSGGHNFILGGLFMVARGDMGLLYRHVSKSMSAKMDMDAISNMLDEAMKANHENFSEVQKEIVAKYSM